MDDLRKAKITQGGYPLYFKGGMMAGYSQFYVSSEYDEDYTVYVNQLEETAKFEQFWKIFIRN